MEVQMASARPLPPQQQKAANQARTFMKLLRWKRANVAAAAAEAQEAPASVAGDEYDGSMDSSIPSLSKLKLSGNVAAAYSQDAFFRNVVEKKAAVAGTQLLPPLTQDASTDSLLANLFAVVSAVKVAYAQLQLAQFLKNPAAGAKNAAAAGHAALAAYAEEQQHPLKTYQIMARKLEVEPRAKDGELDRVKGSLASELRAELNISPSAGESAPWPRRRPEIGPDLPTAMSGGSRLTGRVSGTAAPRYAPKDPSLPKPWHGLVDSTTGYLYYWNLKINATQEAPARVKIRRPLGCSSRPREKGAQGESKR